MSIRPRFKFYLRGAENSWYSVSGTTVVTTSVKTALAYDPVDWAETQISYVRHETYRGVMRAYTAPVTFCEDGAMILRNVFYSQGYNGRLIFDVEQIKDGSQEHKPTFSGEVDFAGQTSDQPHTFQTAVLDRGLIAKIKARQNTPYSIELSEQSADVVTVKMDGVKLRNKSSWAAISIMKSAGVDCSQHQPALDHNVSESPFTQDIRFVVPRDTGTTSQIVNNSYFYTASHQGDVTIRYSGIVDVERPANQSGQSTGNFRVCVAKLSGSSVALQNLYYDSVGFSGVKMIVNLSGGVETTITVAPGDKLALIIGMEPFNSSSAPNRWWIDCTDGKMSLDYFLRGASTNVRAFRQIELWKQVISRISEDLNWNVVSDYLTNESLRRWGNNPYNTFITSGDAVRGIGDGLDGTSAVIKVKMTDLFTDLSNRDSVGLTVSDDTVRIELLSDFFDKDTTSLSLGLVNDFTVEVDNKMLFNVLTMGYAYESNDLLNGKQDPHTTFTYGVPTRYVDQAQAWVSPFTASMYAWEYMRLVLRGKTSQDDTRDNDLFLIEVDPTPNPDGTYNPYRPQNQANCYVQNLEADETAFNLTLMPEYNLRRKSGEVKGTMYLSNSFLQFQRADQNMAVISKLDDTLPEIAANGNLPTADMEGAYQLPLLFKFKHPVDGDLDTPVDFARFALIQFDYADSYSSKVKTTSGFIEKITVVNGNNSVSEWVLKAGPETDLTQLMTR